MPLDVIEVCEYVVTDLSRLCEDEGVREDSAHHLSFLAYVVHQVVVAAAPREVRESGEFVDDVAKEADRIDHRTLEYVELLVAAEQGEIVKTRKVDH